MLFKISSNIKLFRNYYKNFSNIYCWNVNGLQAVISRKNLKKFIESCKIIRIPLNIMIKLN